MSLFVSNTYRQSSSELGSLAKRGGKISVGDAVTAHRLSDALRGTDPEIAAKSFAATPGELAALAILEQAYAAVLRRHLERRDSTLLDRLLAVLRAQLGVELLDRLILEFSEEYLGAKSSGLALLIDGGGIPDRVELSRQSILFEIVVFWLIHSNSAARSLTRTIHKSPLLGVPAFRELTKLVTDQLARERLRRDHAETLLDFLTRPVQAAPGSLNDQLAFILKHWDRDLLDLPKRLEATLGLLAEESAPRFAPGPGPTEIPRYQGGDEIRYSSDRDWMAELVVVAKHCLVWLSQLSHQYGRAIERLDQIPDQELARLSELGFNGLWVIGVWQRSAASARIKQLCGNSEAAGSAYSLVGYRIAEELGGEAAMADLQARAAKCGIRIGVDMVPNHTGLDSDWVRDHPDWFIGQSESPFPSYSFSGPNLSPWPEIELYLEDHYFDRSDAAVVFKRVDRTTGDSRYIYHGNDGTSTPWNDTAQLDFLNPEVQQAVIDSILDVARRFPIVRFDAAMTLTRKHFHRLWYPSLDAVGAIPSRAERSLTRAEFEDRMPEEFWHRVVDRVARDAPDCLLLAEAFWLMEGFFVRTLGMHRVYNSAFMNMLRDGETGRYRDLIEETLGFDPAIMQRYVNFVSNPDELTAIEQFGKGDRYFGVCTLMSTLPGLPMFGHGQVEGLGEKYGMEYRRAYRDEVPDSALVQRHLEQVTPLLKSRALFAGVENFRLFDLVGFGGKILEDVLAFSNGTQDQRALILFNNSGSSVHGRLSRSAPIMPTGEDGAGEPFIDRLASALDLDRGDGFLTFRDAVSGRNFVVNVGHVWEQGLEIDLEAFECQVLTDFRELDLAPEIGWEMVQRVGTRGAVSLELVQQEMHLEPLHVALRESLSSELMRRLIDVSERPESLGTDDDLLDELRRASDQAQLAASAWIGEPEPASPDAPVSTPSTLSDPALLALVTLPELAGRLEKSRHPDHQSAGAGLLAALTRRPETLPGLFGWLVIDRLVSLGSSDRKKAEAFSAWRLSSLLLQGLIDAGGDPQNAGRLVSLIEISLSRGWGEGETKMQDPADLLQDLLSSEETRQILGVHQFEGSEYMSGDSLESLAEWLLLAQSVAWSATVTSGSELADRVASWWRMVEGICEDAEAAGYRTELFVGRMTGDRQPSSV